MTSPIPSAPLYQDICNPAFDSPYVQVLKEPITNDLNAEFITTPAFNFEFNREFYERNIVDVTNEVKELKQEFDGEAIKKLKQGCEVRANVLKAKCEKSKLLNVLNPILYVGALVSLIFLAPLVTAVALIIVATLLCSLAWIIPNAVRIKYENEADETLRIANDLTESSVTIQLTPENIRQVMALRAAGER